jgi:hypothetical protein
MMIFRTMVSAEWKTLEMNGTFWGEYPRERDQLVGPRRGWLDSIERMLKKENSRVWGRFIWLKKRIMVVCFGTALNLLVS